MNRALSIKRHNILIITTAALNRFVESFELLESSQLANELIQAQARGFFHLENGKNCLCVLQGNLQG